MAIERAIQFQCQGHELLGILHEPEERSSPLGLLLVVGGPQYRIGSHRQFVILARFLASAGVAVLRFDYRGMGDSSGTLRTFASIHQDIAAACDTFCEQLPSVRKIVLWGLCDAATANAFYAVDSGDGRVIGQVALNPWVRTPEGEAEAYVKHYYLGRLVSREFWSNVLTGRTQPLFAARDFVHKLLASRRRADRGDRPARLSLPERLRHAQTSFGGNTLLILSGHDLTAREYEARVTESAAWQSWLESERVTVRKLDEADHTFSSEKWREQVNLWTRDWIDALAVGRDAGATTPEPGVVEDGRGTEAGSR